MSEKTVSSSEKTCDKTGGRTASPLAALPEIDRKVMSLLGNRTTGRLLHGSLGIIQPKLRMGPPGNVYEQEADRVADTVVRGLAGPVSISAVPGTVQRRCAHCQGECRCHEKEELVRPKETPGGTSPVTAAFESRVNALRGRGEPLPSSMRSFFEPRFGHDFGAVRIHTGAAARATARAVNARAFTVGNDVVFGAGEYSPATSSGRHLLAHELAHVVQQTPLVARRQPLLQRQPAANASNQSNVVNATASLPSTGTNNSTSVSVGYTLGAGFGVCSRETRAVPGVSANHAFIDAQGFRYGLIKRCRPQRSGGPGIPLATGADLGLPLNPTAAKKSDHSPDPCNKTPHCVPCQPRPGVTDLAACFRRAYDAYPETSEYVVFPGPNSNTFGGTLARACCQNMESAPAALGNMPGWEHSPAAPIPATCTGPIACGDQGDTPNPDRLGGALRGGIAGLLTLGLGGAGIGALLGMLIGIVGGPAGMLAGAGIGALIGGLVGGGIGGTVGAIAGAM